MSQRRITIPTDREGEPVGAQIKSILDTDTHYQVAVVAFNERIEPNSELIVPVLPSSPKKAQQVFSVLRRCNAGIPMLPVFRSEAINNLESLCGWSNDFLLTPVRELEAYTCHDH